MYYETACFSLKREPFRKTITFSWLKHSRIDHHHLRSAEFLRQRYLWHTHTETCTDVSCPCTHAGYTPTSPFRVWPGSLPAYSYDGYAYRPVSTLDFAGGIHSRRNANVTCAEFPLVADALHRSRNGLARSPPRPVTAAQRLYAGLLYARL